MIIDNNEEATLRDVFKVMEFLLQEAHELMQRIEQDLLDWIKATDDRK